MTAHKINKHLKQLQNYKNLYQNIKLNISIKNILGKQQGGILTNEDNKTYSTKLNEFKDKITDILDKKHNIYFIEYSHSEILKEDDLSYNEQMILLNYQTKFLN